MSAKVVAAQKKIRRLMETQNEFPLALPPLRFRQIDFPLGRMLKKRRDRRKLFDCRNDK